MTRTEYFDNAQNLLSKGQITEEVFWAIIENADDFVDEDDEDVDWTEEK